MYEVLVTVIITRCLAPCQQQRLSGKIINYFSQGCAASAILSLSHYTIYYHDIVMFQIILLLCPLQKVLPCLEDYTARTVRYPRWPTALENILRIKYPNQPSNGEHEQVYTHTHSGYSIHINILLSHFFLYQLYTVTLWHLEKLEKSTEL